MHACHAALWVSNPGQPKIRCVEICFLPLNIGDCVSPVARMTTYKWLGRLTDLEWDVKEPLRTTSSLAVTTLSVPILSIDGSTVFFYNPKTSTALWTT